MLPLCKKNRHLKRGRTRVPLLCSGLLTNEGITFEFFHHSSIYYDGKKFSRIIIVKLQAKLYKNVRNVEDFMVYALRFDNQLSSSLIFQLTTAYNLEIVTHFEVNGGEFVGDYKMIRKSEKCFKKCRIWYNCT